MPLSACSVLEALCFRVVCERADEILNIFTTGWSFTKLSVLMQGWRTACAQSHDAVKTNVL